MAQVQYEGIETLLIGSVDVDVEMNEETGISETTIGTSALGPCLCFMIEFKYYDSSSNSTSQRCFVEHYTYWIDDVNKSSSTILNELLAYLSTKLKFELEIKSFYLTNIPRSNRTARKRPETAINRRKTAGKGGRNPLVQKCI
jgi:hypothetical protein